ncbi:MAG: hypothetical protein ACRDKY_12420, partial [Solirubrobacteraceae bacterium]
MRRAPVLIPILAAALALGACGKDSEIGRGTTGTDTAKAPARTATTPKPVATPRHSEDGCAPIAESVPREENRKRPRQKL